MGLLGLLSSLIGLVAFVAFVWLVTVAFKKHVLWGIGVLLLSPIAAIVFAVKHWQDSRKPFLIYIGSTVASFAVFIYAFAALGGFAMLDMAQKIESGEMTEQDATEFIQTSMDRMQDSGMLDDQEQQDLQKMKQMFEQMQQVEQGAPSDESISMRIPSADDVAEASDVPPPPVAMASPAVPAPPSLPAQTADPVRLVDLDGYETIKASEARRHVGQWMKVVGRDGLEHRGTLTRASGDKLVFEQYLASGTFSFELRASNIKSLRVLHR